MLLKHHKQLKPLQEPNLNLTKSNQKVAFGISLDVVLVKIQLNTKNE